MTTIFETIQQAQGEIPVDVESLATKLGVPVKRMLMSEDMSGSLVKVGPDKYEIHLNVLHPSTRQRFTIAHELGHFVHHRSLLGNGVSDNRAYRTATDDEHFNPKIKPKHETEANRFAASLLMPKEIVAKLRNEGISVQDMADRLEVSKQAMSIRAGIPYES